MIEIHVQIWTESEGKRNDERERARCGEKEENGHSSLKYFPFLRFVCIH